MFLCYRMRSRGTPLDDIDAGTDNPDITLDNATEIDPIELHPGSERAIDSLTK